MQKKNSSPQDSFRVKKSQAINYIRWKKENFIALQVVFYESVSYFFSILSATIIDFLKSLLSKIQ